MLDLAQPPVTSKIMILTYRVLFEHLKLVSGGSLTEKQVAKLEMDILATADLDNSGQVSQGVRLAPVIAWCLFRLPWTSMFDSSPIPKKTSNW